MRAGSDAMASRQMVVTPMDERDTVPLSDVPAEQLAATQNEESIQDGTMRHIEWSDYEELYMKWKTGEVTDAEIRQEGGGNLLDLMEAQYVLDVDEESAGPTTESTSTSSSAFSVPSMPASTSPTTTSTPSPLSVSSSTTASLTSLTSGAWSVNLALPPVQE